MSGTFPRLLAVTWEFLGTESQNGLDRYQILKMM